MISSQKDEKQAIKSLEGHWKVVTVKRFMAPRAHRNSNKNSEKNATSASFMEIPKSNQTYMVYMELDKE